MRIGETLRTLSIKKKEDAIWLLSAILGKSKSQIFLESDYLLSKKEVKIFKSAMERRSRGEPLQYIVSSAPFYGRDFFVDPRVLIPRPETESLVELVLRLCASMSGPKILDIGVGSGSVAVTLKAEKEGAQVYASDISADALVVAKKNAKIHHTEIQFSIGDIVPKKWRGLYWDVIVSNPPYLSFKTDKIASDVKKWEPRIALEPKQKTDSIKEQAAWMGQRILEFSAVVRPQYTVMELSPRVAAMLERKWKRDVRIERLWREADLTGRKRFLLVAWKNG